MPFKPAAFSALEVEELFRPRPVGEPVNMHVVRSVKERGPDFEAMRRLIENRDDERQVHVRNEATRRKVSAKQ
jgi:hypothetical protein